MSHEGGTLSGVELVHLHLLSLVGNVDASGDLLLLRGLEVDVLVDVPGSPLVSDARLPGREDAGAADLVLRLEWLKKLGRGGGLVGMEVGGRVVVGEGGVVGVVTGRDGGGDGGGVLFFCAGAGEGEGGDSEVRMHS